MSLLPIRKKTIFLLVVGVSVSIGVLSTFEAQHESAAVGRDYPLEETVHVADRHQDDRHQEGSGRWIQPGRADSEDTATITPAADHTTLGSTPREDFTPDGATEQAEVSTTLSPVTAATLRQKRDTEGWVPQSSTELPSWGVPQRRLNSAVSEKLRYNSGLLRVPATGVHRALGSGGFTSYAAARKSWTASTVTDQCGSHYYPTGYRPLAWRRGGTAPASTFQQPVSSREAEGDSGGGSKDQLPEWVSCIGVGNHRTRRLMGKAPGSPKLPLSNPRSKVTYSGPSDAELMEYGGLTHRQLNALHLPKNSAVLAVVRSITLAQMFPESDDLIPVWVTPVFNDYAELLEMCAGVASHPVQLFIFVQNGNNPAIAALLEAMVLYAPQFYYKPPTGGGAYSSSHSLGTHHHLGKQKNGGVHVVRNRAGNVGFAHSINTGIMLGLYDNWLLKNDPPHLQTQSRTTAAYASPLGVNQSSAINSTWPPWIFACNADVSFPTGRRSIQGLRELAYHANVYHEDFGLIYSHEQEHYAFGISRQAVDRVGLLDEALYPAYMEDVDYHWRVRLCGLGQMLTGAHFLHRRSVNLRNSENKEFKEQHVRSTGGWSYGHGKWGSYHQADIYRCAPPSGWTRPWNLNQVIREQHDKFRLRKGSDGLKEQTEGNVVIPLSLWAVDPVHRACIERGVSFGVVKPGSRICWYNGTVLLPYLPFGFALPRKLLEPEPKQGYHRRREAGALVRHRNTAGSPISKRRPARD